MHKKTFVTLFAVVFVSQIGMGIVAPLMPLYAQQMGASGLALGIMFSGFAFARVIFTPVAGRLADVQGRKRLIAFGLSGYTVASLLYVWASNIVALTVVRFVHGLSGAMILPVAQAYIGELIPRGKEGTYFNLFSMSMFLGMGCGPALGGILTEYVNMNAAFYAMTALSCLSLFLLFAFVPALETHYQPTGASNTVTVATVMRDGRIQAASIFRLSRGFWRQGIIAFLPLLATSTLQMTPAGIGAVLSVYLLSDGAAQGITGPLVDRLNKLALLGVCSTLPSALLFLIPYTRSGGALLAILLPVALMTAIARGAVMAFSVEAGRDLQAMGTVMGLTASAASLGMMAGPTAFGYTSDLLGLDSVFAVGAVTGIVGGLLSIYLYLRHTASLKRQTL